MNYSTKTKMLTDIKEFNVPEYKEALEHLLASYERLYQPTTGSRTDTLIYGKISILRNLVKDLEKYVI